MGGKDLCSGERTHGHDGPLRVHRHAGGEDGRVCNVEVVEPGNTERSVHDSLVAVRGGITGHEVAALRVCGVDHEVLHAQRSGSEYLIKPPDVVLIRCKLYPGPGGHNDAARLCVSGELHNGAERILDTGLILPAQAPGECLTVDQVCTALQPAIRLGAD